MKITQAHPAQRFLQTRAFSALDNTGGFRKLCDMPDLSIFVHALGWWWVAIMSGIFSILMSIYEKALNKKIEFVTFLVIGFACLFVAFYYSWDDEYQKQSAAESELKGDKWLKEIGQQQINQLLASHSSNQKTVMKAGNENTFIGKVPQGNYGSGNVFVGATDSNGNTFLNAPMAVGHNATAGSNSIAIGSGAKAGDADRRK